jgi:hypothetical protein
MAKSPIGKPTKVTGSKYTTKTITKQGKPDKRTKLGGKK